MTIHLSIVLFLPLAAGLVGAFLPARAGRWVVLASTVAVLGYVIAILIDFESGSPGLQYVTNDKWIPELGVRYQLGIDGLNLFMVALTAIAWVPCTLVACFREPDRPRLFFFNLALAETAVLGAFLAQDLALFIVFFDLMLVPFYFLIGGWGSGDRVRATTKFVIYTLSGLAADARRRGGPGRAGHARRRADLVLDRRDPGARRGDRARRSGSSCSSRSPSSSRPRSSRCTAGSPRPTAPRPIVVLALLSGVLSKVGVYGFLRIVMPTMPDAAQHYQELMLVVAVFSILYGSVLAFSQDNVRMVIAYSSIAQLGFIVLGIFSLDPKGAQGAVFQMLNHGLVVVPVFLIIGVVAARAGGASRCPSSAGWPCALRCWRRCS